MISQKMPNASEPAFFSRLLQWTVGLPWGLIVLVTALVVAMVLISPVDYAWTQWLVQHNDVAFSNFIGRSLFEGGLPGASDFAVIALLAILVLFILAWARPHTFPWLLSWRPRLGFMTFSALVYAVFFVHSTKWIWGRFRPYSVLLENNAFTDWFKLGPQFIGDGIFRGSFPSGHTAASLALMSLAYVLVGTGVTRLQRGLGWGFGVFVLIYSLAMSVGRAMTGAHWLSDCVASIGSGWILLHIFFYWGLRVPEQCRWAERTGLPIPRPRWWEWLLAVNAFWVFLGFWGCGIGLRALEFGRSLWLAFLIPLWLGLMFYGAKRLWQLGLFAKLPVAKP